MNEPEPRDPVAEFNLDHGYADSDCLFVNLLREKGFDSHDIEDIIVAYESVCHECFDSERPCHCANDE